jgi:hypothetical protein
MLAAIRRSILPCLKINEEAHVRAPRSGKQCECTLHHGSCLHESSSQIERHAASILAAKLLHADEFSAIERPDEKFLAS